MPVVVTPTSSTLETILVAMYVVRLERSTTSYAQGNTVVSVTPPNVVYVVLVIVVLVFSTNVVTKLPTSNTSSVKRLEDGAEETETETVLDKVVKGRYAAL